MNKIMSNRTAMQCPRFDEAMSVSDQKKDISPPPQSKAVMGERIELKPFEETVARIPYTELLDTRRSKRVYKESSMTQEQLAFLLWSAQGIQTFRGVKQSATLRPVPSGGARHPFELYAAVRDVVGLKPGLYRYAPLEHVGEKRVTVEYLGVIDDYTQQITSALAGQRWAAKASVVLFVSCVPYRSEWRYSEAAHRVMLIDLGHLGQNIMLSAVTLGLGSCCMAAYDQALCDAMLGINSTDEYTVYAIAVGEA